MRTLVRKVAIAALALAALLTVAAAAVIVAIVVFDYPGGMRPSYRATDHDARLTPIAWSAAPIIAVIDRYYAANGKCPRVSEHDLAELLAGPPKASPARYTRATSNSASRAPRTANDIIRPTPNRPRAACRTSLAGTRRWSGRATARRPSGFSCPATAAPKPKSASTAVPKMRWAEALLPRDTGAANA